MAKIKTPKSRLATVVRALIKKHSPEAVAKGTGLQLGWVRSFVSGAIKSPGVDRVEHLYTVLTGKDLPL
jgi:hypothetical protein